MTNRPDLQTTRYGVTRALRGALGLPGVILLGLMFGYSVQAESVITGGETRQPPEKESSAGSTDVMSAEGVEGNTKKDRRTSPEDITTARLLALLNHLTTFSADFSQTVLGARSELLQSSEGTIQVQRPAHFRWEVNGPYPQLIVSNGDLLYLYDPDLEQVQVEYTRESLSGTPALLLSGTAEQITHSFQVERSDASEETSQTETTESFILYPRDKTSLYRQMAINFAGALPVSFQIIDNLDQRTEVTFFNIQSNIALGPELFQFSIPPGVDITGNAAERALPER